MTAFAEALKKAIDSGKISVYQLAQKTGLSRVHIYRLMRGEQAPALDTAEAIAKEIGVKITIES